MDIDKQRDAKRPKPSTSGDMTNNIATPTPKDNQQDGTGASISEDHPVTSQSTASEGAHAEATTGGPPSVIQGGDPHPVTLSRRAIKDQNVPTFRLARKLQKLNIRAKNHVNNLGSLLAAGRVPKGLTVRRFPINVPNPSVSFQLQWDRAHMELSQKLTNLLYQFWLKKEEETDFELQELNDSLKSKCTPEEHAHVMELLADSRNEYLIEINSRNAKKIRTPQPVAETEEA